MQQKYKKYTNKKESHAYMREMQRKNIANSKKNKNENFVANLLNYTGYRWKRQAQWGFRIFDFWCHKLGLAIEVDGPEHNKEYDAFRDQENLSISGIKVIRVKNNNIDDIMSAMCEIKCSETWNERRTKLGLTLIRT